MDYTLATSGQTTAIKMSGQFTFSDTQKFKNILDLVSENKTLCYPASADSIPTSLGQEDHVSMGSISGRKLNRVLDNLEFILAIELLSACQAIEFRRPLKSSEILESAHDYVREFVSFAEEDRIFAEDINKVAGIIKDLSFVEKVNGFAGSKGINLNHGFEGFSGL